MKRATVLVIVLVLGGSTAPASPAPATEAVPTAAEAALSAAPNPASASAPAPAPPPPAPAIIPDRAFLQPADTNGGSQWPDVGREPILPTLCGTTYPSDSSVRERRVVNNEYRQPGIDAIHGVFTQTITAYRRGGAAAFMRQLRAAVARCRTEAADGGTRRHRLRPGRTCGEDSVVLALTREDRHGEPYTTLTAVVRVGDVVVLLSDQGYEEFPLQRAVVDDLTARAVRRVRAWLG